MDKKKAAASLKADASFGDSDSTTLLQEQRRLVERTDDRTPVMPVDDDSSVPLPAGAPFSLPVRDAGFTAYSTSIIHRKKPLLMQTK